MMENNEKSFVVVKFLKSNIDSEDNEVEYEVGRTKWLVGFDVSTDYVNKESMILWPRKSSIVSTAVKMDKNPDSSWKIEQVQVKKLYNDVLSARNAVRGYEASSTYESEYELGRGCRKRKKKQDFLFNYESEKNKCRKPQVTVNSSTEDEDDYLSSNVKDTAIPSPPPVKFSIPQKSSKSMKRRNNEDEKLMKKIKLKIAQHEKQKEHSDKENMEKKFTQNLPTIAMPLYNENSKEIFPPTGDKNHETDFDSETFICNVQNNNTESMTSQKNYMKSFNSDISFSDDNQLANLEKSSMSNASSSNNLLQNRMKSCNSQLSLMDNDIENPMKSYSSQVSIINNQLQSPTKSCTSQLFDSQLRNSTKITSQSNIYHKNSEEYNKHEIRFLSPSKYAHDNGNKTFQCFLLKEILEIKKKAAIERQEINLKLDKLMSYQCRLSYYLLPNHKKHVHPDDMPSYPLKSDEEMNISEEFLKINENFGILVHHFAQIKIRAKEESKGKDSDVLYAVMAAAVTNSLACKYNFRGDGNKKRPFCKLLLWEAIIGAVHNKRPDTSITDLSTYAGQWLKNAPYRKQDDGSYGKRDKKESRTDE